MRLDDEDCLGARLAGVVGKFDGGGFRLAEAYVSAVLDADVLAVAGPFTENVNEGRTAVDDGGDTEWWRWWWDGVILFHAGERFE